MIKKTFQYLFVISIGFPLLFLLLLSLGKQWIFPDILPQEIAFSNWQTIQKTESNLATIFIKSIFISTTVAFLVTTFSFAISKAIAYSKNKTIYLVLAYIPYLLSPVIIAVLFHYFFIVTNLTGTFLGIVIAQFLVSFPFGIIIFSSFWNQNIKAIEELSYTLGSSVKNTYLKILLPISKNTLLLCFFQVFLISWFEYGLTNLIGTGKVKTLTISVFKFINEANVFYAAFASCLLVIPPMLLLYINKKMLFFVENNNS